LLVVRRQHKKEKASHPTGGEEYEALADDRRSYPNSYAASLSMVPDFELLSATSPD
jgi:hypothetical protein